MGANYNAPGSQYNKDEFFAKLGIDAGFDADLSEAIAVDIDENRFMIFAYVTAAANVQQIGNKEFVFTAQPCKFEIPKKTFKGYGDKDVEQHALHTAIAYAIQNGIGYNKPFKATSYGANSKLQAAITTGEFKGKQLSKEDLMELIGKQAFEIEEIDALDKLKDAKMEASKGFQKGGGMNAKKLLEQRLEFVEDCIKDGSKFRQLAESLNWNEEDVNQGLSNMLNCLMN